MVKNDETKRKTLAAGLGGGNKNPVQKEKGVREEKQGRREGGEVRGEKRRRQESGERWQQGIRQSDVRQHLCRRVMA